MNNRNHSIAVRITAVLLVMVLVFPVGATAATVETVQPLASAYLDSYSAYIHLAGGGKIGVYFTVTGTDYMDSLGALTIRIYESADNKTWTWVRTFTNDTTPGMLGYNHYLHGGNVDYYGVAGRYYKAHVSVWAGENGGGDTRYFWTSVKKAA